MYLRRQVDVVKKAAAAWVDDRAQTMGAALSYYTVFSLAPLLLIAISVAGLVFGEDAARGAVVRQLQGLIGRAGAQVVEDLLRHAARPAQGTLAALVGVAVLLVGATSVFSELQDDLDAIWKAPRRARVSGAWALVRARVLSIGMILAIGFLMLVSLAASAAFDALGAWAGGWLPGWAVVGQALNVVIGFMLTTALFAAIYRFLPQARIEWRDVVIGALVTALLFTAGKSLIGLYIGRSAIASGFGAAGSLAVVLAWVYYSAQIFLFGAEFTWAYAHACGSRRDLPPGAPRPPGR
ncbi:MAG TPA: YihY/virulence factor BrkB family protein [Burkholderiaceae bacterium]